MHKVDISADHKEADAIAARRRREEERKHRIFDAKFRTKFLDVEVLNAQVEEKRKQEEHEKLRNELYAKESNHNARIAIILEQRELLNKKRILENIKEYWQLYQRPEDRKEFDLNDPNALKKAKPLITPENESTLGASSLLKFTGEDLNRRVRSCHQTRQLQDWIKRQMAEKVQAKRAADEADRLNALRMREMDERACKLSEAEEMARRAIREATDAYNEALAKERSQRKELKKAANEADNQAELANSIFSDLLTENPDQAISNVSPFHKLVDRYKGLSPEQVREIHRIRAEQVKEKRRLLEEEKRLNDEWNQQIFKGAKLAELLERKYEVMKQSERKKLADENILLAQQHTRTRNIIENEVYKNEVYPEFFDQFNTTTR